MFEPLTTSCDFLAACAPWTCREAGGRRCDWYHGSWQYLRMLDLVSNPAWHADYLATRLPELFAGHGRVTALISGCADYSTFAHLRAALGERVVATALDWCPTPLIATQWYARHAGLPVPPVEVADAASFVREAGFDLIISDSFLPRFDDPELARMLAAWRRSLRPGGAAVTTARVHERPTAGPGGTASPSQRSAVADRWRERAEAAATWWSGVSTLPVAELVDRTVTFARNQERNAVYDTDDVRRLFARAGFERVEITAKVILGKSFARVVAS